MIYRALSRARKLFQNGLLLAAGAISLDCSLAQVPVAPIVNPHITFVNGVGQPCSGCKLYTYAAGTTTPLATYSDASGGPTNTNPIILDIAGGANIWVGSNSYKFVLKDTLGATIWSVDQVNAGSLFPCPSAGAIQIANSSTKGLDCDPSITINTSTHTINVGTLGANYVTIGALGTPTSWTFDTTSPATACASLGCGGVNAGLINQLAYYAAAGTTVSGTTAVPDIITATTRSPGDNSQSLATTAYVALPGPINPTSVQVGAGMAMTDNQGDGAKVQHSTGSITAGDFATYDADGNVVDSGIAAGTPTARICGGSGCYRIDSDGTIEEWGTIVGCSGNSCSQSVTFPHPFTTATNLVVTTSCDESGRLNCASQPNVVGTSGFSFQYTAFVIVGGSGVGLDSGQTGRWYAIGN